MCTAAGPQSDLDQTYKAHSRPKPGSGARVQAGRLGVELRAAICWKRDLQVRHIPHLADQKSGGCYATKSNRVRIVKTPGEEQLAELLLRRKHAERHAHLQVAS